MVSSAELMPEASMPRITSLYKQRAKLYSYILQLCNYVNQIMKVQYLILLATS